MKGYNKGLYIGGLRGFLPQRTGREREVFLPRRARRTRRESLFVIRNSPGRSLSVHAAQRNEQSKGGPWGSTELTHRSKVVPEREAVEGQQVFPITFYSVSSKSQEQLKITIVGSFNGF